MTRWPLETVVERLSRHYGAPPAPPSTDPLALILWENVAYLSDDENRAAAFDRLKKKTGLNPKRILATSPTVLETCVAAPGRFAALQVEKLRASAELVIRKFDGDLGSVLGLPTPAAIRALRQFPAIGEPGAEKILLFAGKVSTLALESNGLRVLLRLGFGEEHRDYRRTYRSVQEAITPELSTHGTWLVNAHLLLRTHGQTLCTRTRPQCPSCPLQSRCPAGK